MGQVFHYPIDPDILTLWPDPYDSNSRARFITSPRAAMGARLPGVWSELQGQIYLRAPAFIEKMQTSRLGRGTRFSIDVPIGAIYGDEPGQPTPLIYDDESVLFGAVVVIIDDEVDILAAVELLLKQWGCQVIAADCGAQATEKLKSEDAVPDFILSDYRLRDDETGIGVIQALRATYGGDIPALLLTGDTAGERLRDATASGLEVLHKPLDAGDLKHALIRLLA